MYRRILVPTDFSEPSEHAFTHALALAKLCGAEIVVLHAFDRPPPPGLHAAGSARKAYLDEAAAEATARLTEWASRCVEGGCSTLSVEGKPWVEILNAAEREACDLICMASHGRGALAGLLVGSVTERVLHRSSCPVLVIRPEGHRWRVE